MEDEIIQKYLVESMYVMPTPVAYYTFFLSKSFLFPGAGVIQIGFAVIQVSKIYNGNSQPRKVEEPLSYPGKSTCAPNDRL